MRAGTEIERDNKAGDAAGTRVVSRRTAPRLRTRKPRPIDGRTREARRWKQLYEHYAAAAGGRHDTLARALASVILKREQLDQRLARGEDADPLTLCRLSGEARRLLARLDLLAADDAIDQTDAVIASIRARRDHEAAR